MGVTTEVEKANKEYADGKIGPWERYVRVKREIKKRLEGQIASRAKRNGRWLPPLLRR